MTSTNISMMPKKELNVLNVISPHAPIDLKTPTLATPIDQQTPMDSLFAFDEQTTSGLSANFLSLNPFGNLSNSSLLNGLTVTSPIASNGNGHIYNSNNNILALTPTIPNVDTNKISLPLSTRVGTHQMINAQGQIDTATNINMTNMLNTPNMLYNSTNINTTINTATTITNTTINNITNTSDRRPLVPDGQSGLFPNATHTPLIADAMKAYSILFPQATQSQQQSLGHLNHNNNNNGINSNIHVPRLFPLGDSFSDLKIETNQIQNNTHTLPSMTGVPPQPIPVEMISNDPLFELSRDRSITSLPEAMGRGESAISAAMSQGNAHFVPLYQMEQQVSGDMMLPQISDGGLVTLPTSVPTIGNTLPFTLPMGQPMPMENNTTGLLNGGTVPPMNGIMPGFPPVITLGYEHNPMPNLEGLVPKTYPQEYWPQAPFGVPISQYVPSIDLTMNANAMPFDPSTSYNGMGSYTTTNHQINTEDYNSNNVSILSSPDMEESPTSRAREHRQTPHSTRMQRRHKESSITPGGSMAIGSAISSATDVDDEERTGGNNDLTTNFERDNISLMDLTKNELIEKCARDQHGSRFIQRALETANPTEKSAVFKQIEKCALGLCEDVFGNYVIQKFFEHGTENQKTALAKILIGRVLPLTKSMYGCRVIQKAFESVESNLRIALVSELDGYVEECVRDQNGNHVIQKAIEEIPAEHLNFIVKTFHGKVYDFSTHPYGCRVIQRLLERATIEQKEPLLMEILKQVSTLSKDQYGNYVVQHVLQHGTPQSRYSIIQIVATNIISMSRQKFSSNVVEKSFTQSGDKERDLLIDHIMGYHSETPPVVQMVRDQYGNYVIQKILEVASQQQRNRLINRIFELVPNLRKLMFGKHIINKIERITGKVSEF